MHLHEDSLEVLSVEWTEWYPQCRGNKSTSGVSGVRQQKPSLTPKLRLHFLLLQQINSFTSPMVAHARSCIVKGLAFVGASEGSDHGALDVKRRPLLVVLLSQQGRQEFEHLNSLLYFKFLTPCHSHSILSWFSPILRSYRHLSHPVYRMSF